MNSNVVLSFISKVITYQSPKSIVDTVVDKAMLTEKYPIKREKNGKRLQKIISIEDNIIESSVTGQSF